MIALSCSEVIFPLGDCCAYTGELWSRYGSLVACRPTRPPGWRPVVKRFDAGLAISAYGIAAMVEPAPLGDYATSEKAQKINESSRLICQASARKILNRPKDGVKVRTPLVGRPYRGCLSPQVGRPVPSTTRFTSENGLSSDLSACIPGTPDSPPRPDIIPSLTLGACSRSTTMPMLISGSYLFYTRRKREAVTLTASILGSPSKSSTRPGFCAGTRFLCKAPPRLGERCAYLQS